MGVNQSKVSAAEGHAAEEAKHAQMVVLKDALLKKVEEHEERLHNMERHKDPHLDVFKKESAPDGR